MRYSRNRNLRNLISALKVIMLWGFLSVLVTLKQNILLYYQHVSWFNLYVFLISSWWPTWSENGIPRAAVLSVVIWYACHHVNPTFDYGKQHRTQWNTSNLYKLNAYQDQNPVYSVVLMRLVTLFFHFCFRVLISSIRRYRLPTRGRGPQFCHSLS